MIQNLVLGKHTDTEFRQSRKVIVVEYPYVVVGGGAPEVVVSKKLREWSSSLTSRQQLAAEKYADALESIPMALAENAGMSLVDAQAELRSKSQTTGKPRFGVDV